MGFEATEPVLLRLGLVVSVDLSEAGNMVSVLLRGGLVLVCGDLEIVSVGFGGAGVTTGSLLMGGGLSILFGDLRGSGGCSIVDCFFFEARRFA